MVSKRALKQENDGVKASSQARKREAFLWFSSFKKRCCVKCCLSRSKRLRSKIIARDIVEESETEEWAVKPSVVGKGKKLLADRI